MLDLIPSDFIAVTFCPSVAGFPSLPAVAACLPFGSTAWTLSNTDPLDWDLAPPAGGRPFCATFPALALTIRAPLWVSVPVRLTSVYCNVCVGAIIHGSYRRLH